MKAEGQKAGAQKVTHGSQVWDGEVVGIHTPPPQQTDDEVGNVEEDGDLGKEDKMGGDQLPKRDVQSLSGR